MILKWGFREGWFHFTGTGALFGGSKGFFDMLEGLRFGCRVQSQLWVQELGLKAHCPNPTLHPKSQAPKP